MQGQEPLAARHFDSVWLKTSEHAQLGRTMLRTLPKTTSLSLRLYGRLSGSIALFQNNQKELEVNSIKKITYLTNKFTYVCVSVPASVWVHHSNIPCFLFEPIMRYVLCVVLCCVVLRCGVVWWCVVWHGVVWWCVVFCYVVSCNVVLRFAVLCCVLLCCVVWCCVVLCFVVLVVLKRKMPSNFSVDPGTSRRRNTYIWPRHEPQAQQTTSLIFFKLIVFPIPVYIIFT